MNRNSRRYLQIEFNFPVQASSEQVDEARETPTFI